MSGLKAFLSSLGGKPGNNTSNKDGGGASNLGLITVRGKTTQQISDVQLAAETTLDVAIWALDVSKSGILCGCDNGSIHLLTSELTPIRVFTLAHRGPVTALAWHSDGIHFLSVGLDRCVRVWSLMSLTEKSAQASPILSVPHSCAVTAACFDPRAVSIDDSAPSSVWFFSAGTDGRLRAWRGPLLDQYESLAPAGGDRQPSAIAARLDGSGALLAVGGQSGHLLVLRFADGQFTLRAQLQCKNRSGKHANGQTVVSVCWVASDELLLSTHDDRLRLLRYKERELIPIGKFKGHQSNSSTPFGAYLIRPRKQAGAKDSNESYLVSGSESGHVYIWRRDATGLDSHSGEVDTADSYERFVAVEKPDKMTACVPAPWEPEKIEDDARLHACSVVATLQGMVRIFYNRGAPVTLGK